MLSLKALPLHRALLGALLLSGVATSQAATLRVTTVQDGYDGLCDQHCSLRDAVAVANQSAESNTILLPSGTYVLNRNDPLDAERLPIDGDDNLLGDLDIRGEVLITGAGIGKSIITGPTADLFALRHRLFEVRPDAQLELKRLTLMNGRAAYNGGAVENHGRLVLHSVRAEGNITRNDQEATVERGRGGAIANYGDLVVRASQLEKNTAATDEPAYGGAIYNLGRLWVRDSTFKGNSASDFWLSGSGSAIYNSGRAVIWRSAFLANISMESAEGGVITNEGGELILSNSTLSGNWGGALTNGRHDQPQRRSKATLTHVTVVDNSLENWGTEAVSNWGDLRIRNSLIAGNHFMIDGENLDQPYNCRNYGTNFSYQALGLLTNDAPSNCSASVFVPDVQTFTQVLFPLTQLPNQTWAHALRPGSPAVDAGIGTCINEDQRVLSRPQDGNGDGVAACDLGAYELGEP
ncbi:MAG: choice-of-anchor Q domain-containing protein [Pseudomonadota bacterium]